MMNVTYPVVHVCTMAKSGFADGRDEIQKSGLEQFRSGLLQQRKPFIQAPQPVHQFQILTQQHQQLMLAQQNMTSPSYSVGDVVPNIGSPLQTGGPILPRRDTDMLRKLKMAQLQQQQLQQHALSNQQSQNSNLNPHQLDKMGGAGGPILPRGDTDTLLKLKMAQLHQQQLQQHALSSQQSQNSNLNPHQQDKMGGAGGPILPRGDTDMLLKLKMAQLRQEQQQLQQHALSNQQSQNSNLNPHQQDRMGGAGSITMDGSMSNSFRRNDQADMDRFEEDGSLDDNVESHVSPDDVDHRDAVGRCVDASKGFTFAEVSSIRASASKVTSCHFSSDGKLLASGGHDKKAVLWYTDTLKPKSTLAEHSALITDVRFSPSMPRLATSSFDKTVRVWDADNPGYSLCTFMGHSASVMSLDFHPNKDDLICSCDGDGQIRYWSINNGTCSCVSKGGTAQMRFQPRLGRFLAAAAENVVSILDVETQTCRHSLQGHTKPILSVCWDPSGKFLASVSEDSVRVWTLGAGGEGECVHELSCNGNKFHSCVFHPTYTSLLVIGCYQTLELWNMTENKTMTLPAHEGVIASLAVSTVTGLIASASHDKFVKIWK